MTKFEIKDYLEKVYSIPVAKVNTEVVVVPLLRNHKNQRFKPKDDYKIAHITLVGGIRWSESDFVSGGVFVCVILTACL